METRRYRILGLVGQGGYGRVYRARLEAAGGFVKDVAIKILDETEPSQGALERLRDEARVLGLVRDRALVAVEPPTKLNERWAIIMEYVDGCTLARLQSEYGRLPPDVALEIVAEVARLLDKVYAHPGPDGRPLHVLHRDLKPSNVQVTPHGEVKILDFGTARAEYENREAHTSGFVLGTPGFIAPERFEGQDGPEGDVYSLGVILETLLTGRPRGSTADEPRPDRSVAAAMVLARDMTRTAPDKRPNARDAERRAGMLAAAHRTVGLRSWAEERVPPVVARLDADPLVGEILTETLRAPPVVVGGAALGERLGWFALLSGGVASAGGVVVGVTTALAALVVLVWSVWPEPAPPPTRPEPESVLVAPPPPLVVPPPPPPPPPPAPVEAEPEPQDRGVARLLDQGWRVVVKDPTKALALFSQAREAGGGADASYGQGYALMKLGRREEAAKALCVAVREAEPGLAREVKSVMELNGLTCP